MEKTVVELFAGVGGFRVGLNEVTLVNGQTIEKGNFKFVWVNQWEPATKAQHAFDCYQMRFGTSDRHCNQDIATIDKNKIENHTLLVGGFPCQDYSVARSLVNEKGIEGKKGVLWWQINEILDIKRPPFVLLENVDRLIKSPSKQRGRDFGIMLRCFNDLGYAVEWRVINAAEYGHPQRRRRIYIFAYHSSTDYYKKIKKYSAQKIMHSVGIFASSFPVKKNDELISSIKINKKAFKDLISMTKNFNYKFKNSGYLYNGIIYTIKTNPTDVPQKTLKEIIQIDNIPDYCFLDGNKKKFEYLKSKKKIPREKNGVIYNYSEGSMDFPDKINKPGRTMLTSEGTINRSTHVITDIKSKRLRTLTPIEAERLNEFPDNWTNTGMPIRRRFFMMGNALVCGIIKKLGDKISIIIENEK